MGHLPKISSPRRPAGKLDREPRPERSDYLATSFPSYFHQDALTDPQIAGRDYYKARSTIIFIFNEDEKSIYKCIALTDRESSDSSKCIVLNRNGKSYSFVLILLELKRKTIRGNASRGHVIYKSDFRTSFFFTYESLMDFYYFPK